MIRCGVDYRKGQIFVTIRRWSKDDFHLDVLFGETTDLQPHSVGVEVRRALETARVEEGRTWSTRKLDAQSAKLHEVAGTKGWSEFMRGAAHVSVKQRDGSIVVTPSVNAGSRDGFLYAAEDRWIQLDDPTDEELGEAVRQALIASGADI